MARILIVEDDRNVREVLAQILAHQGHQVHSAVNGLDALTIMRCRFVPDLILLNLTMPVMNGWAFRAEQKLDPVLAGIPVLLLSGEPEVREIAGSLGAEGAISKPVYVPELLRAVEEVLVTGG